MAQVGSDGRAAPRVRSFILKQALIALGLAAATPAGAGPAFPPTTDLLSIPTRDATPALWEVRDGDTIIYLFGTFHTLDRRTQWFDRSVRTAFDRSSELVLETIVPEQQGAINSLGRQAVGARPGAFLAATRSAMARSKADGLSVELGADAVLRRAANDQGKTLAGLELFEDQLRQFAQIPATAATPARVTSTPAVTLAELLTAWKAGDTAAFTAMLAGFEAKAPAAYRILIADRNARWGEWIANRLDQPGTIFVAVGSGHLAGKDSVQNWLSSRGIYARRVS